MNGTDLLHEARDLVASGWCQGAEALDDEGFEVDACGDEAACWSLLGALQAAAFCDESTRIDDVRVAVSALADLITDPSLAHWNDQPARTQGAVVDLLDRAEHLSVEQTQLGRLALRN